VPAHRQRSFESGRIEWRPANRVWYADPDNGIVRRELDMLRVVKDMSWRFAEPGASLAPIHSVFHVKNYRTEARVLEFGLHALQKRTLKSGRKKREKKSNADPRCESFEVLE
jgi:hypothetical protein